MSFTVTKLVDATIKIAQFFPLELKSERVEVVLTFTAVDSLYVAVSEPYYEINFDVTATDMNQKGRFVKNFYSLDAENILSDAERQLQAVLMGTDAL
ncbi:hypothetical protein [Klebsiella pneumoniae]|uniref:hypothetical protein n=1 Tax=Klebsiella pneumoniae TaxID=573 RepID=UPI001932E309|nr:hypothetical protein [Klebsiella pneumoniae]MBM0221966.1 hypothetical protein [Klebsiella pneumoniae]